VEGLNVLENPMYLSDPPEPEHFEEVIANLSDLCEYFSADEPRQLNRRIYKDTVCGASISVKTPDGQWHHNGENWSEIKEIVAFTIQTIVEGSDATVDSDEFVLPVKHSEVVAWMSYMENEAARLWDEANESEDE